MTANMKGTHAQYGVDLTPHHAYPVYQCLCSNLMRWDRSLSFAHWDVGATLFMPVLVFKTLWVFFPTYVHNRVICPSYETDEFIPWLRQYVEHHNIQAIIPSEGFLLAVRPYFYLHICSPSLSKKIFSIVE